MLEQFISGCTFLGNDEINRATLIATELFDNILQHTTLSGSAKIVVVVEKKSLTRMYLVCHGIDFGGFTSALSDSVPHFDSVLNRYRGMGIKMCNTLAASITYQKGLFNTSIIIIL